MLFNNQRCEENQCPEMERACPCDNGMMNTPICEPVQERCIHKTFVHEVPHICPIRTRVINHHVYKHTYRPEFSCVEENVATTIDNGSCCNFR